jgi:DNA replication and repair protein RecF
VALKKFTATGFRCLQEIVLEPDPRLNIIVGPNASGKTSLLESLFYLSRGRSFRGSGNRELIQIGRKDFVLFGCVVENQSEHRAGVEIGIGQRRIKVDGQAGSGADLARLFPVQVIDPEIHELVQGGPELRRRFLDWGVFHVKHAFLETWRDYQKALRQRNAALRAGEKDSEIQAWDEVLARSGELVHQHRTAFLEEFLPLFSSIVDENLLFSSICSYKSGWSPKISLRQALVDSLDRDRAFGSTQVGPHRADLTLEVQDRRARHRISRGQQKMLAAALVIAQSRFVADRTDATLILLVDDPAAELDRDNRERLFQMLENIPAQMFITALEATDLPWSEKGQLFHVEHGKLNSLL